MPRPETFLVEKSGGVTVSVTKTYDPSYAREVFAQMHHRAKFALAEALEIAKKYEAADIPDPNAFQYDDFLWEELKEEAVEDVRQSPQLDSFFVVSKTQNNLTDDCYVSADWPSAEKCARQLLAELSVA